nr:hypothetical protein [Pseudoxanthomonas sp.]
MTNPLCYEIVTYRVDDAHAADLSRNSTRDRVKHYPGFIAWTPLTASGDALERVDLVAWRSNDDAKAAAQRVGNAPEFAEFRASINTLVHMGHYSQSAVGTREMVPGHGVEIGHFRLKPGIDESTMRQAYSAMVETHLSGQPGWCRQHLIKLEDGSFIDLALADSRERSQALCAGWQGQPSCEAFLALIEPASMRFGELL